MSAAILSEDMGLLGWFLQADAGHARCEGWSYEPRTGELLCSCQAILFRLEEMRARKSAA